MAGSTTTDKMSTYMEDYINKAVKLAISDCYDAAIEQMVIDARAKRDEVVAATALKISSSMRIHDQQSSLVIEIVKATNV